MLQKNDAVCPPPPFAIWCCSLIQLVFAFMLLTVKTSPLFLSLKAITLSRYTVNGVCGESIIGGFLGMAGILCACLFLHVREQLIPSAFNSPLARVKVVFESRIIQWAQQEAFIWLSLWFPASVEGANIREDIRSRWLFCHSCVRGRNEYLPGDVASIFHLKHINWERSSSSKLQWRGSWRLLSLARLLLGQRVSSRLCHPPEPVILGEGWNGAPPEKLWLHISPLNLDPELKSGGSVHHFCPLLEKLLCNGFSFSWFFLLSFSETLPLFYQSATRNGSKSEVNNREWPKDLQRSVRT